MWKVCRKFVRLLWRYDFKYLHGSRTRHVGEKTNFKTTDNNFRCTITCAARHKGFSDSDRGFPIHGRRAAWLELLRCCLCHKIKTHENSNKQRVCLVCGKNKYKLTSLGAKSVRYLILVFRFWRNFLNDWSGGIKTRTRIIFVTHSTTRPFWVGWIE